jgi:predicted AAA+ superfamily ATPase
MATTRGSRSGRTAWQFIQDLAGLLGKPLDMPDKASQIGRANF